MQAFQATESDLMTLFPFNGSFSILLCIAFCPWTFPEVCLIGKKHCHGGEYTALEPDEFEFRCYHMLALSLGCHLTFLRLSFLVYQRELM